MYATPNYSLYTSSFKKLDLIEVNESMKLKGSEMGTKMQKIESRSQLASSIAARSSKRENFGKLQQAVGPGDRLTTPICGQHHHSLYSAVAAVWSCWVLFLRFSAIASTLSAAQRKDVRQGPTSISLPNYQYCCCKPAYRVC